MSYRCPQCRYLIADAERLQARIDYLCPQCKHKHYSEFEPFEQDRDERESNP